MSPLAPLRPCAAPACSALVRHSSRCPAHAQAPFGRRRTARRTYGSRHRRLREQVLERDGYRCVRCGATERLQADHIDRLGPDALANYMTLCRSCNLRKAQQESRPHPGVAPFFLEVGAETARLPAKKTVRVSPEKFG